MYTKCGDLYPAKHIVYIIPRYVVNDRRKARGAPVRRYCSATPERHAAAHQGPPSRIRPAQQHRKASGCVSTSCPCFARWRWPLLKRMQAREGGTFARPGPRARGGEGIRVAQEGQNGGRRKKDLLHFRNEIWGSHLAPNQNSLVFRSFIILLRFPRFEFQPSVLSSQTLPSLELLPTYDTLLEHEHRRWLADGAGRAQATEKRGGGQQPYVDHPRNFPSPRNRWTAKRPVLHFEPAVHLQGAVRVAVHRPQAVVHKYHTHVCARATTHRGGTAVVFVERCGVRVRRCGRR